MGDYFNIPVEITDWNSGKKDRDENSGIIFQDKKFYAMSMDAISVEERGTEQRWEEAGP